MPVLQPEKTKPQKKPQARGFHPDAMAQAQALNQQPDSIPAMMKPGEYVLPPDTVAAMGGPGALDATVAQTHTPANAGAIVPKGFEPRLFFSSGGLAQEEEQNPKPISPTNTYPQGSPSAGANDFGRQPSAPTPMASTAPKTPALVDPQSRINEQMANAQRQRAEGIAAVQRGQAYDSITQQQRQQAYDTWQSTRQHGILPQPRSDMRQQEAEKAYSDTLAGRIGVATPSKPPEQLANQLGGLDRQHAQNVQLQAAARTPEQARAEATQQSTGQQVPGLSGVYKHGEGQYSDNAQGMGLPQNLGQPSAQNMQAANALASQQQAQSMARLQATERQSAPQARGLQGFEMPRQENAYERENRMRERNRIMGLLQTPMTGDPRRDLTASQRQQLVAQLEQESQERQATERNMFDLAGQQLNAESQRYNTDASTAAGADRNTIDQQRVGMEATTKGFDVRQSQRKEAVQSAWEKASPEQRSVMKEMYPDFFGNEDKKQPYSFDVVRGSSDPVTGKREGDYAVVFDPNTGKYRQVQVGQ